MDGCSVFFDTNPGEACAVNIARERFYHLAGSVCTKIIWDSDGQGGVFLEIIDRKRRACKIQIDVQGGQAD